MKDSSRSAVFSANSPHDRSASALTMLLGRVVAHRPWGTRLFAVWRALRGYHDAPQPIPEHLVTINLVARYQADIVRQAWRDHHTEQAEFQSIVSRMGADVWMPKRDRYVMLWRVLRATIHLPGAVAECGVYRGATARLIAETMKRVGSSKPLYLLDTFAGLPGPTPGLDGDWKEGDLGDVMASQVRAGLSDIAFAHFLEGLFADTFAQIAQERFCFVHIDCDLYASVKECCEFFYERTVAGGCLLFDDYGIPYCPGAKKAVDEFFAEKPEQLIYLPTGQCFAFKRAEHGA